MKVLGQEGAWHIPGVVGASQEIGRSMEARRRLSLCLSQSGVPQHLAKGGVHSKHSKYEAFKGMNSPLGQTGFASWVTLTGRQSRAAAR